MFLQGGKPDAVGIKRLRLGTAGQLKSMMVYDSRMRAHKNEHTPPQVWCADIDTLLFICQCQSVYSVRL